MHDDLPRPWLDLAIQLTMFAASAQHIGEASPLVADAHPIFDRFKAILLEEFPQANLMSAALAQAQLLAHSLKLLDQGLHSTIDLQKRSAH